MLPASPRAFGARPSGIYYDVQEEHTKNFPEDPWTSADWTTSYTGLAEVEPGVCLLAYDKIGSNRIGSVVVQKVFSVRINVTRSFGVSGAG